MHRLSNSPPSLSQFLYGIAIALFVGLAALFAPGPLQAQQVAAVVRGGSTGIGGDVIVGVSEHASVRTGATFFQNNQTTTETFETLDVDLDVTVKLFSFSAILDYFPWTRKGFHLSAGAVYNGNVIDATATPQGSYTVGSRTYSPDDIGRLDGEVSFSPLAPYVGVGFGNPLLGRRLGLTLDIGTFYHNAPKVTLNGSGMIEPTADQAPQLEKDLDSFRFFPVLSVGLAFRLL